MHIKTTATRTLRYNFLASACSFQRKQTVSLFRCGKHYSGGRTIKAATQKRQKPKLKNLLGI